ncbi:MAG: CDP-alcohol phosphatidyltransferase family protein [Alteromonadales bacterium]|nr:CDP-alcohol phosphatidyltransferase family protein [Alteromonadales bacterium]
MLTIYDLKPRFQGLLRPIVKWLAKKGVSANQVTWSAMVLSLIGGATIYFSQGGFWSLLFLPVVLFIRMGLNAIDGMLAREHNMQTRKGAMLNEMTDVMSDVVLYIPLAFVSIISPSLLIAFVIIGVFTEMAGVVAQAVNNDRRYDGQMGKSDRAFAVGLLAIILAIDLLPTVWLSLYLLIGCLLGIFTLYNRMHKGVQ